MIFQVICDEGHVIKNEKSLLNQAINQIKTKKRILLTGTPIQNNLLEYFSMLYFVNPNALGNKQKFIENFAGPIK